MEVAGPEELGSQPSALLLLGKNAGTNVARPSVSRRKAVQMPDYTHGAPSRAYGSHVSTSTAVNSIDNGANTAPTANASMPGMHPNEIFGIVQPADTYTTIDAFQSHPQPRHVAASPLPAACTHMAEQHGVGSDVAAAGPTHMHARADALAAMQKRLLQGPSSAKPSQGVLAASQHSVFPQGQGPHAHNVQDPVTACTTKQLASAGKAPYAHAHLALDENNDNAVDEPPHKVVCASRKGSPSGAAVHDQRGTRCMVTELFNPQHPYPARPVRPPHLAPLPCPLGSTWAPTVECGPPLIVPEGFELPEEVKLAPQPELVPQKPPKPPQPTALLSRWAIDPQAAMLAAQGRTPPVARKPPKPRRTANRGRSRQPSPARKAAAAAAMAAAAVTVVAPDGVPVQFDTQAVPGNNEAGRQGSCDLNTQTCAPVAAILDAGGSGGASEGHMTCSRSGPDGLPPVAHTVKQLPTSQVVELAHEWWEVRLQWCAFAQGSEAGKMWDFATSVGYCSEGDVCVARFLEASHAQASLLSTAEMLTLRAVPGNLPDLQHEWHLDDSPSATRTPQSLLEQEEADAGAMLRVKCSSCNEKWYLVRRTEPTAEHELVRRPVTIQESPWRRLMAWHHVTRGAPASA